MPERVLTAAELNRASLGRQLLLERAPLEPVEAIERLVALQAQEPASPYVALWSRVHDFRPESLDEAFRERRVVKGTLLRVTLHAVSAADYLRFWPAMAPTLRIWREQGLRRLGIEVDFGPIERAALAHLAEPRTNPEMAARLPRLEGTGPAGQTDSWWAVRPHLPAVHVPRDVAWSFGRRPTYVAAESWLGRPLVSESDGLEHLIRGYLAGFGPAALGDLARFTRIERRRLRPALERLVPQLRLFRDEAGRLLYDVPDGELPPPDTPAPVRFLPMWDSLLLAYEHGGRVAADAHRRRILRVNGDWLPTFLVDGQVAGLWRSELVEGRTTIRWDPFEPLSPGVEDAVRAEAERLAAFVEPLEPAVFSRYARMWMGQPPATQGEP